MRSPRLGILTNISPPSKKLIPFKEQVYSKQVSWTMRLKKEVVSMGNFPLSKVCLALELYLTSWLRGSVPPSTYKQQSAISRTFSSSVLSSPASFYIQCHTRIISTSTERYELNTSQLQQGSPLPSPMNQKNTAKVHFFLKNLSQEQVIYMMQKEPEGGTLTQFSMLSLIGLGNYARVILVRRKSNGRIYAMKIVKKSKPSSPIKGIKKEHAYIQKQILNECKHPFIVKLHSTFQHHRKLYYILEYCPGGELFGLIRRLKRFSEQSTKFYAAQIVLAIEHLHSKKFVYRDLKPENVLITRKGYIRLVDFGLSCRLDQLDKTDPIAGTPEYLPPQIFQKGINISPAIDWWALGNLIFEMITGFPPFFVQHQKFQVIKNKICNGEAPLYFISNPLLKDLLLKLLDKNPKTRLGSEGASSIRSHGWFYGTNWQGLLQQEVAVPFVPELKGETDTHWFETDFKQMSPPEQSCSSEKSNTEKYQQFSLSWKSSRQLERMSPLSASPPEITINISEMPK